MVKENKTKNCEICNKTIQGRIRATTKYCSRVCANRAIAISRSTELPIKECLNCLCSFTAKKSRNLSNQDKFTRFCSNKCASEYQSKSNKVYECECCKKSFRLSPSREEQTAKRFCSINCAESFLREENSPAYKDGFYIHSVSGKRMILITGKDSKANKREVYIAEGRLVASEAIGRPLLKSEVVIHINDDPLDVSKENLFICGYGDARKIKQGTHVFKLDSNLDSYR